MNRTLDEMIRDRRRRIYPRPYSYRRKYGHHRTPHAYHNNKYRNYHRRNNKIHKARSSPKRAYTMKYRSSENNKAYTYFYGKNPRDLKFKLSNNKYEVESKSNKPKIPASGELARDVIHLINQKSGAIVNHKFARRFVRKYKRMCRDIGYKNVKPKIIYHWTNDHNFESIVENGLKVPDGKLVTHKTDIGFYGKGIYTSPDPLYAKCYGGGTNKLFVCLSLPGRQYKAVYPDDLGCGLKDNHDSHISNDRCGKEWIFFSTEQILCCYLIDIDKLDVGYKLQLFKVARFLERRWTETYGKDDNDRELQLKSVMDVPMFQGMDIV